MKYSVEVDPLTYSIIDCETRKRLCYGMSAKEVDEQTRNGTIERDDRITHSVFVRNKELEAEVDRLTSKINSLMMEVLYLKEKDEEA